MEWAHSMSDDDTFSSRAGSDVEADSSDSESQVGSVASCWSLAGAQALAVMAYS